MVEVFKDVKGYIGLYQVSNLGNVKGLKNNKLLSQKTSKCGYKEVNLFKDRKGKSITVHRLVAQTFIPNPDNKPQVNHIDGNKENNTVSNLEWITNYDNMQHSIRTGLRDNKKIGELVKEKRGKKVMQYDLDGNFIKCWNSVREVADELNIDRHTIRKVCKGETKQTHNYIFFYAI